MICFCALRNSVLLARLSLENRVVKQLNLQILSQRVFINSGYIYIGHPQHLVLLILHRNQRKPRNFWGKKCIFHNSVCTTDDTFGSTTAISLLFFIRIGLHSGSQDIPRIYWTCDLSLRSKLLHVIFFSVPENFFTGRSHFTWINPLWHCSLPC